MDKNSKEISTQEIIKRYPCLTAHIIAESLGDVTLSCAARILKDTKEGRENCCEWIYTCYNNDPRKAVQNAIRNRHNHKGLMAEYKYAKAFVDQAIETGKEPLLASWF